MKKQTMITLALALTLAMPTLPAFAQKAMSKKEIAEKEKAFKNLQHPWKGKKVAYFGDSITDPNIKASKVKYWGFCLTAIHQYRKLDHQTINVKIWSLLIPLTHKGS